MPQLRRDPIIGRWVITATERSKRPVDFITLPKESSKGFCPFVMVTRARLPGDRRLSKTRSAPNTGDWWLRVVPNKFPALTVEGSLDRRGEGMYDLMTGIGAHEVIIETPKHGARMGNYDLRQIEELLWMYRNRVLELSKDRRFRYMLILRTKVRRPGKRSIILIPN